VDLLEFDLNLLRSFDAIYRHQNLSAAAMEMGLTQPALSAALKRLRDLMGNPLFVRTSHGMRPTPFADNVALQLTRALDILRNLDQPAEFSPQGNTIHYRIYINDVGMLVVMPQVLRRVSELAPRAKITILDLRPDEVVDALDRGDIDLAIGLHLGMPNWAHQQTVRNTSYVCTVRAGHPDITDSLSLEQFLRAQHAMYWTTGSPHSQIEEVLARRGLTRSIGARVPRFAALPFMVAATDMIATIPQDLGLLFSRLVPIRLFVPPLELPDFEIKQYWHERHHAEPGYRWLRAIVRDETQRALLPDAIAAAWPHWLQRLPTEWPAQGHAAAAAAAT
jgi:DNA-binding transcriptional LysR family regulator